MLSKTLQHVKLVLGLLKRNDHHNRESRGFTLEVRLNFGWRPQGTCSMILLSDAGYTRIAEYGDEISARSGSDKSMVRQAPT